jgi:regulator of replication initiation timing
MAIEEIKKYYNRYGANRETKRDVNFLVKQIKSLQAQLAEKEEENAALRAEVERLKGTWDSLEQDIDQMEISCPQSDEWMKGFEDCRMGVKDLMEEWPEQALANQQEDKQDDCSCVELGSECPSCEIDE